MQQKCLEECGIKNIYSVRGYQKVVSSFTRDNWYFNKELKKVQGSVSLGAEAELGTGKQANRPPPRGPYFLNNYLYITVLVEKLEI
jgi:hypothetical protein